MRKIINEGLDYGDFEDHISPVFTIDEYVSKIGEDSDMVTLAFVVKGRQAAVDLANWFERGYDFVLDAQVSEGEIDSGKYLVFVELERRSAVPDRVIELIEDLETLTKLEVSDWRITINDEEHPLDPAIIKKHVPLSPSNYRKKQEEGINEMRQIAGLNHVSNYDKNDELKEFLNKAGI